MILIFVQNTKNKLEVKEFQASEIIQLPEVIFSPQPALLPTPEPTFAPTTFPSLLPTFAPPPTTSGDYVYAFVTFYGWPDNGPPPGNGIAYPKGFGNPTLHDVAGGIGTYGDPVSFASDNNLYPVGSLIYLPHIRKYAIMEDLCIGCVENWENDGRVHVDIWMESDSATNESKLFDCMGYYTHKSIEIENNPPSGRPVDTRLLFNPLTGECLNDV